MISVFLMTYSKILLESVEEMNMGRVFREIDVKGKKFWTLFDSGAENTYVIKDVANLLPRETLPRDVMTSLGGRVHKVNETVLLVAAVEGYHVDATARCVDEIGEDKNGRKIEILFGALAMQNWGININLKAEKLDFSHYPKEFVEF
jgi:hypothetical protein